METSSPTTTSTPKEDSLVPSPANELSRLRNEVQRLQGLIGPSEESYRKLQLDVLGARDAAIAAEAELGYVQGQVVSLETQLFQIRRDYYRIQKLQLDVLGARDAAIAAEAELGYVQGQVVSLETQLFQIRRDYYRIQRIAAKLVHPRLRGPIRQALSIVRRVLSGLGR